MEQVLRCTSVSLGAALALLMWLPTAAIAVWGLWLLNDDGGGGAFLVLIGSFPTAMAVVGLIGWRGAPDRVASIAAVLGLVVIAAMPIDVLALIVWGAAGAPLPNLP
jgi:hypothetical protein